MEKVLELGRELALEQEPGRGLGLGLLVQVLEWGQVLDLDGSGLGSGAGSTGLSGLGAVFIHPGLTFLVVLKGRL